MILLSGLLELSPELPDPLIRLLVFFLVLLVTPLWLVRPVLTPALLVPALLAAALLVPMLSVPVLLAAPLLVPPLPVATLVAAMTMVLRTAGLVMLLAVPVLAAGVAALPAAAASPGDHLDFVHGTEAFINAFPGASLAAMRRGFQSAGAEDNSFTFFPELMDSASLFLTGNCDTVYFWGFIDLTGGPMVLDIPPLGPADGDPRHHR